MIMEITLTVSAVAHKQAGENFLRDGLAKLSSRFIDVRFELDDEHPDVLLFLSGGSERMAISRLSPGRFTLLLASSEGNAFASAMEVKAWGSANNIPARIMSLDDADAETQLKTYARVFSGLRKLQGQRAGLIGDVSHWLVASALNPKVAKDRLGIDIMHLPWKSIPNYLDYPPHPEFLEVFAHHQKKHGTAYDQRAADDPSKKEATGQTGNILEEANDRPAEARNGPGEGGNPWHKEAKNGPQESSPLQKEAGNGPGDVNPWQKEAGIYAFLMELIREQKLDALTLECFDMVNDHHVTACLSLALLNSKGFPSGCEGDLVSLAGIMLAKEVTGQIPWMANVASMNDNSVLFAHCTAPLDLLEDFTIDTHFETDKSAAIAGHVQPSEVTVFRMDEKLEKAFIAPGTILSRPGLLCACRTQTDIELHPEAIRQMKEAPLGNHHLILPGNQVELLRTVCQVKNIAAWH